VAAQDVADRMVAAGITSILNFAPAVLQVPEEVAVRKVDLSIELQILAYHEQRKAAPDSEPGLPAAIREGAS
jgi:redox-sensing transcriptional repressor